MTRFIRLILALWLSLAILYGGAPHGNCNACKGGSSSKRSASTARSGNSGRKIYARTRTATGVRERHVGTRTAGKVVVMTPRSSK